MALCKHYEICGRDALEGEDLCILHSHNPEKDKKAFDEALAQHRMGEKGTHFSNFFFPGIVDFEDANFNETTYFYQATFAAGVHFFDIKFPQSVNFSGAKFTKLAEFTGAQFNRFAEFSGTTFNGRAGFSRAIFNKQANFIHTTFSEEAKFRRARFKDYANFEGVMFDEGANFLDTSFTQEVNFTGARFLGQTFFGSMEKEGQTLPVFSGVQKVDFTQTILRPLDALAFRDADLQNCLFTGTDLRKADFANVTWPRIISNKWPELIRKRRLKIGSRNGVFDEIEARRKGETHKYPHIEQLYRQLKQNHEDRKDYERASDFHYGEKEMRRRNPNTALGLKFWLTMYWLVSGYGERWIRPLLWFLAILGASTLGYLWGGLIKFQNISAPSALKYVDFRHFLDVLVYSLQVMILLKPGYFEPYDVWGRLIYTGQIVSGPILLGLFALAVRQRLKR